MSQPSERSTLRESIEPVLLLLVSLPFFFRTSLLFPLCFFFSSCGCPAFPASRSERRRRREGTSGGGPAKQQRSKAKEGFHSAFRRRGKKRKARGHGNVVYTGRLVPFTFTSHCSFVRGQGRGCAHVHPTMYVQRFGGPVALSLSLQTSKRHPPSCPSALTRPGAGAGLAFGLCA